MRDERQNLTVLIKIYFKRICSGPTPHCVRVCMCVYVVLVCVPIILLQHPYSTIYNKIIFFPLAIYVILILSKINTHKNKRTNEPIHFLANAKLTKIKSDRRKNKRNERNYGESAMADSVHTCE